MTNGQPGSTPVEFSDATPLAPDEHDESHQQDVAQGEDEKAPGDSQMYQPAMRIEIPAVPTPTTETTDGFFKLRPWQATCFAEHTNSRNWLINAPTAAGKALESCAFAADRLKRDTNLRIVIAVPQSIIAEGFRRNKIEMPDGTRVDWEVTRKNDLCAKDGTRSTARLLRFLTAPIAENMMDRVVLCTHSTLVRAFGKDAPALSDVLIILDEAHHIKHGSNSELQIEINNQMGALVKYDSVYQRVTQ